MEGKGHRKMTLFSYLCTHTDTRPGAKILMSPLYLRFCSCSPCSELAPGDPILLSFWTLSSLQDSWNSVLFIKMGFSGGSNGKESTGNAEDRGLILDQDPDLGQEDPVVKEMATRVSLLAWKITWTEEPCSRLQPMGTHEISMKLSNVLAAATPGDLDMAAD